MVGVWMLVLLVLCWQGFGVVDGLCNGNAGGGEEVESSALELLFGAGEGLSDHTIQTAFSPPGSGIPETHVFILNQRGQLDVRSQGADAATVDRRLLDWTDETFSWHDRGMSSFAFHPNWGTAGNYYIYILYTGQPDGAPYPDDQCTTSGQGGDMRLFCPAPGVLHRFILEPITNASGDITGYEDAVPDKVLLRDWWASSMTHHMGTVLFLNDGSLVVSSGEGSQALGSIDVGLPYDPTYVDDGAPNRPQGAFRSQRMDFLNGKVIRVTAAYLVAGGGTQMVEGTDFFIIAVGLRNPFKMTLQPSTGDVFVGDVGSSGIEAREEINRIPNPAGSTTVQANFGWPCMEGTIPHPGFSNYITTDAASSPEKTACESMYSTSDRLASYRDPVYSYRNTANEPFDPEFPDACEPNGSTGEGAITGLSFYPEAGTLSSFLGGKLVFTDYAKRCSVYFDSLPNGNPDFASRHILHTGEQFVDVKSAPDGLVYFSVTSGSNHGVMAMSQVGVLPPVAAIESSVVPANVEAGATITFDASSSITSTPSDPIVRYAFDFTGDAVSDVQGASATRSFTFDEPGLYIVSVTAFTQNGGEDCADIGVLVGVETSITMDPPSGQWEAGDEIEYVLTVTGAELDPQDVVWTQRTRHCSFDTCQGTEACHTHEGIVNGAQTGFSGSFTPLAHELPSSVALTATIRVEGTLVEREFETTARTYEVEVSSTPVMGASFRNGEAGEVCASSNPPCTVDVMANNNLGLSPDSLLQADSDQIYAFSHWSVTPAGGATTRAEASILSSVINAQTSVRAHFEALGPTLTSDIDAVTVTGAQEEGFERIRVSWGAVAGATHYIIYLETTTALGHAHLPTSSYARATVVPASTLTDTVVVVPDGVFDMEVRVRGFNADDLTLGPLSEPETVSVTSSDNTCVATEPECDYAAAPCTTAVSPFDRSTGLGAFYDLLCLEYPNAPGCTNTGLDAGCRLCYTDRCAWSDANDGVNPGNVPDCPPCVAEAYGMAQPTASCTTGGDTWESQTGETGPSQASTEAPTAAQSAPPTAAAEAPSPVAVETEAPIDDEDTLAPVAVETEQPVADGETEEPLAAEPDVPASRDDDSGGALDRSAPASERKSGVIPRNKVVVIVAAATLGALLLLGLGGGARLLLKADHVVAVSLPPRPRPNETLS